MTPLALLLDPRGAIGRGDFLAGLAMLAGMLILAMVLFTVLGAIAPVDLAALGVIPTLGPPLLASEIAEALSDGHVPLDAIPAALLLGLRLYPLACLVLKRLRDAGRGPASLIVLLAASLVLHGLMGRWAATLWASEIGALVPAGLDAAICAPVWTAYLVWLCVVRPARRAERDGVMD